MTDPRGGELPRGEEKVRAVRQMFDTIAPRYDLVNRVMTFGLDRAWRRSAVEALGLQAGSLVLDVACGTADLCRELAAQGLRAVGVDLSAGMLSHAKTSAPLVLADALALPAPGSSFDGVISGFALRNVVSLERLFSEMARVLKPAGRLALLEVGVPSNPLLRAGHAIYFGRVVPRIGGMLSDKKAYSYLPRSVEYLPEPSRMVALLEQAGFPGARRQPLSGGIAQLWTATRSRCRDL